MVKNINAIQAVDTGNLVTKADYNIKFVWTENKKLDHNQGKYITTQEFNLKQY